MGKKRSGIDKKADIDEDDDEIIEEIFVYNTLKTIKLHLQRVDINCLNNKIQELEQRLITKRQK